MSSKGKESSSKNVSINRQDWQHSVKRCSRNQWINIDKFRVAANITEFYVISKLIFLRIIHVDKTIISCKIRNIELLKIKLMRKKN